MQNPNGKIYFASDFHLGIPDRESSLLREKKFIRWLNEIEPDAEAIYLMGDLFDFWFEYRTVVPRGYTRLFARLAEITEKGIPVHFFRGNHDLWAFSYLNEESGVTLHDHTLKIRLKGKNFFLAHGDGLGPGDHGYKLLKKVFRCRFNQFLFRWLHPDIGTKMGLYFSKGSRISNMLREDRNQSYQLAEKEFLLEFSRTESASDPEIDYFVFGHRHIPTNLKINDKASCIILGDWVKHFSYGVYDGKTFEIEYFEKETL
jgi:UDP-2,3-diacylglucosamine hydrolase